jgi:hypothetical protein
MHIQFAMDQLLFMSVLSGPSGCTKLLLATSAIGNKQRFIKTSGLRCCQDARLPKPTNTAAAR